MASKTTKKVNAEGKTVSSSISIKVGAATATVTLNATDAQVGQALQRYASSLGIPTNGTNGENLTAVINHIIDDIRRKSKQVQADALRAANEATITGVVESDNAL